jgi:A/G-specific adenine glycosylase
MSSPGALQQSLIKAERNQQIVAALISWFNKNARDLPWRRTKDPYAIWVSEIMLQQTQVATVIPYFERWMKILPTLRHVVNASEQHLLKLWEGLGYYSRVRNIQKAARQITDTHDGKFPTNYEDLLSLPGIGRYTAGAISSIAFDQPQPVLDGNVIRVLARLFGIQENPRAAPEKFWKTASALVIAADRLRSKGAHRPCSTLNQALMELGATVCLPRQSRCDQCPVRRGCYAVEKNLVDRLPNTPPRPKTIARKFIALVFTCEERVLVRQRDKGSVNGGLWEFPNLESITVTRLGKDLTKIFGKEIMLKHPFSAFTHSITRYRIVLQAFSLLLNRSQRDIAQKEFGGRWITLADLESFPFASAHRKIANITVGKAKA